MSDPNDFVICGGGARPEDKHLASTVRCVDDEIIEWLKRREERTRRRHVDVADAEGPLSCRAEVIRSP